MRRRLSLAALLGGLALAPCPALAQPAAVPSAPVPAAPAARPAPAIRVRTGAHPDFGRVTFQTGAAGAPVMRQVDAGVELRFRGQVTLDLSAFRAIRQLGGVETRTEGEDTVALLRCSCEVVSGRVDGFYYVDLREKRIPAAAGKPSGPTPTAPAGALPGGTTNGNLTVGEAARLRDNLKAKLAILNGSPAAPPATGSPAPGPAPAGPAPANPIPGGPAVAGSPAAGPPLTPPAPPPPPPCRPSFDLAAWKGAGMFAERQQALRAIAARATEGAPEMAALAELYVAYGLGAEALDIAAAWHAEDPLPADRDRLARVADVARLLRHEPVEPASLLLAAGVDCTREDLPLWRAVAAAVAGDQATVQHDAGRARALLRDVPDPLRIRLALLIADAAGDDPETLRVMSAALRNSAAATPEDEAGKLLLEARLARTMGSTADEVMLLERAAGTGGGAVPALEARARLAAVDADREGPSASRAETVLTDLARTYRYEPIGQDASAALAEARLHRGNFAGALEAADNNPLGGRLEESRGARITARILRTLLVEPPTPALPGPAERLALYWRYEGYATPGAVGDDIRLGAARLMLAQELPEGALDVLRQLTPAASTTPQVAQLRALAEARATTGDPQAALALLATVPPSDDRRRATAAALARLGHPAEAAAQLDGLETPADRAARADMLLRAANWPAAASAYAGQLRDPGLPADARRTVAERAALAAALAHAPGKDIPPEAVDASPLAAHALAVAAARPAAPGAPVEAAREAIERARNIETLLKP